MPAGFHSEDGNHHDDTGQRTDDVGEFGSDEVGLQQLHAPANDTPHRNDGGQHLERTLPPTITNSR